MYLIYISPSEWQICNRRMHADYQPPLMHLPPSARSLLPEKGLGRRVVSDEYKSSQEKFGRDRPASRNTNTRSTLAEEVKRDILANQRGRYQRHTSSERRRLIIEVAVQIFFAHCHVVCCFASTVSLRSARVREMCQRYEVTKCLFYKVTSQPPSGRRISRYVQRFFFHEAFTPSGNS